MKKPLLSSGQARNFQLWICFLILGCLPAVPGYGAPSFSFPRSDRQFLFGIATAPAHAEDELQDAWAEFARAGKVAAISNQYSPYDRLKFWSEPEVELNLAAATGVRLIRLGVDWSRLVPTAPIAGRPSQFDMDALEHYRKIIKLARRKNLAVMLTLFHHSLPTWAEKMGGWRQREVADRFVEFSTLIAANFGREVDFWITFNEPTIFGLLTYVAGKWPPGYDVPVLNRLWNLKWPQGSYPTSMANISYAHNEVYARIHLLDTSIAEPKLGSDAAQVGVAHLYNRLVAASFLDEITVAIMRADQQFAFIDKIVPNLDFLGINYYGRESISGLGVPVRNDREYSESGREIDPNGFFEVLQAFDRRYNGPRRHRNSKLLPIWITENGISDSTDILRPSYVVEHLAAVHHAIEKGVPIRGYTFWTISDNWEWADGYCPKFGLVDVDRADNLKRLPRPSFAKFSKIVRRRGVSGRERDSYWDDVLKARREGALRPFCRGVDGETSLDEPSMRPFASNDWRFHKPFGLVNFLQRDDSF